jgi:hypothetical protein
VLERPARHTIELRCFVRFEASCADFSFVELDDQPFTNPTSEKSGRAPDPPPRAKYKSVIFEQQTISSVLHSSESSS